MGKLALLPGVLPSPEVVLQYAIDHSGKIKEVIVVALLDDDEGHVEVGWSAMPYGTLTFMERILSLEVSKHIEDPEGEGST